MSSFKEEYQRFCELNQAEFVENEPVYVVSKKWLLKLKLRMTSPIPINNDHLFQNGKLKLLSTLKEDKDYVFANKTAWEYLYGKFGCSQVIQLNTYRNPATGKLIPNSDVKVFKVCYNSQVQSFSIISMKKIHELKELACQFFKISPDKSRLRNYSFLRIRDVLDENQIIEDCLCSGQHLLLETCLSNGDWPQYQTIISKAPSTQSPSSSSFQASSLFFGRTGFRNLGNTCYMNSILQCLIHIPILKQFFLQNGKSFSQNDNYVMAGPLSDLFHLVWEEGISSHSPYAILVATSSIQKTFNVHQQQDSHDFLTFVLEEIHKEISTGDKTKILPERPYGNESNYKEIAEEVITSLRTKEDSPISRIFDFLTIQKLVCNDKTVRFSYQPERFLHIDLALPQQERQTSSSRVIFIPYHFGESSKTFKADFSGKSTKDIEDIIRSKIPTLLPSSNIAFAVIDQYNLTIFFHPPVQGQNDIFVFELPNEYQNVLYNTSSEISTDQAEKSINPNEIDNDDIIIDKREPIRNQDGYYILTTIYLDFPTLISSSILLIPFIMVPVSSNNPNKKEIEENLAKRLRNLWNIENDSDVNLHCSSIESINAYGESSNQNIDQFHPTLLSLRATVLLRVPFQTYNCLNVDLIRPPMIYLDGPDSDQTLGNLKGIPLENLILPQASETAHESPNCEQDNSIETRIYKPPPCLIFQLKRFIFSNNEMKKNDIPVSYPEILDLSPLLCPGEENQSVKYQLASVSLHSGILSSGHYTAQCRNELDGKWYLFNDETVTPIDHFEPNPKAYLLFYCRL